MGKKPAEKISSTSKEHADILSVETFFSQTSILMLRSTEEHILQKVTSTIYKHIANCEERKKEMVDLGAVDYIWNLLSHDNKIVRRNSIMVLGSLTAIDGVSRSLKKRADMIATLEALLKPSEEEFTREFALLLLVDLSCHYTGRSKIIKSNIIYNLPTVLSSQVPETQYYATSLLLNLLNDDQTKTLLKEIDILKSLLNVLHSEYQNVQINALLVLAELTKNDDSYIDALIALHLPSLLVNFLANSDYNNAHVYAIDVLANFLRYFEPVKAMKMSGQLKRLVSIINDQPITIKEEQLEKQASAAKITHKSGSSLSRKGKATSMTHLKDLEGGDDGKDSVAPTELQPHLPTQPITKEHFCLAIAKAACICEVRKLMVDIGLEELCVKLMKHPNVEVNLAACQLASALSECFTCKKLLGKFGAIGPLVELLRNNSADVVRVAISALSSLTSEQEEICTELSTMDDFLLSIGCLLRSGEKHLLIHSSIVLTNVANMTTVAGWADANAGKLLPYIVDRLMTGEDDLMEMNFHKLIRIFVRRHEDRQQFCNLNGIKLLVAALGRNAIVHKSASETIAFLTVEEFIVKEVIRQKGLEALFKITNEEWARIAVRTIFDNFLPAKFAYTGVLESTDLIKDCFYDMGAVSEHNPFQLVEDYIGQPINDKRPIYLINGKEDSVDGSSHALIDVDQNFLSDLEEAEKLLAERTSVDNLVERAVLLAEFVSVKMGGTVPSKADLYKFGWRISLGLLRYLKKSNVLPVGDINKGIYCHRALLFKALGDKLGIPNKLVRIDELVYFNEISVSFDQPNQVVYLKKGQYIIDLIHEPGKWFLLPSPQAQEYLTLFK